MLPSTIVRGRLERSKGDGTLSVVFGYREIFLPGCHISQRAGGNLVEGFMPEVKPDSAETCGLLEQVAQGAGQALGRLLQRYRPRLRAFIAARLDPQIRSRMDPSDVVQEVQLEVARRIENFLKRRPMPFHLWVRRTAYERLLKVRRDHRRRARRSVNLEVPLPDHSSVLLAKPLLAQGASPSQQLAAREFADRVGHAVGELAEADREILLMRHMEGLNYAEISCLLGIEADAARKRYGRALLRLRKVLKDNGLLESSS
jgi:RNA polymerase sigma-70 factor (ECF subfamily)